jgi:hypothetical protein
VRTSGIILRNLVSPYGLTAASICLFLIAYFMPPSLYSRYVSEPDYLFLDPTSLLFFLLCTLGFLAGLQIIDYGCRFPDAVSLKRKVRISPTCFILLPLVIGMLFCLYATYCLLRDNRQIVALLLALEASGLKEEGMEINGPISQATPLLMGLVWWALARKSELSLPRSSRRFVAFCIAFAFVLLLLSTTLMVARSVLMPVLAGVVIVVVATKLRNGHLTSAFAFKSIVGLLVAAVVLFLGISVLRGLDNFDAVFSDISGYSIASYNRLAAMLAGNLRYPYAGRGLYISAFASFNRTFNQIFHLNQLLDWPDFASVWNSEFGAVSAAGLDGRLIWSGSFGYIYSDLGWFSPLLLLVYGLVTGWAWKQMKRGTVGGIVLYPWCAYCILFWFGTNFLLDPKAVDLLALFAILALYESCLSTARTRRIEE